MSVNHKPSDIARMKEKVYDIFYRMHVCRLITNQAMEMHKLFCNKERFDKLIVLDDHNSVYAELSLTPKTLEWFNTNKSKSNYSKLLLFDRIKFCDSEHNILSSFRVQFLRTVYNGRCCLPNNRPFKFIANDKFVVQFRLI